MSILVTGGAGYVGSHTVKRLVESGEKVIVIDDLSAGHKGAVSGAELVVGDFGDKDLMRNIIKSNDVEA
ncbi:MAG: NAD-dependent epimerase/dehydratase family protein, partial [Abditibacteriota bacterium]|nr:NAD-dependent epimerase/dehydratase family protein [Abditibacteriota bacterium]